ncbi:hypothetical protein SynBIOSE41_02384 [Synechococcus sp. BIOS-E4-1]|uniref:DUF1543 domain-containing protein n=1 Tax=Synechococcus sp. BIOS-E4-1 TaxID=1400864 RepID=UPI0016463DFF|nr:DUF1543 domain-containing protein [Synechococcus sp. BIOS-E4-1]QNI54883.1 hypothetical protein SynBIOSE41_02384 [Synechococcus sp. BIOS-E4-1]
MNKNPRLFLVVLGGRSADCHIELHDVRWVVGANIEETIPKLRQEWFGLTTGLHIDSYKVIQHVDGYTIELFERHEEENSKQTTSLTAKNEKLWFINLGGYDRNSLQELHQFGLVVAPSKQAAKARARQRWLNTALQVHKDDLHSINNLGAVDDCLPIFQLEGWQILLKAEPGIPETELKPDWFGYWRIDGRVPKPRPE